MKVKPRLAAERYLLRHRMPPWHHSAMARIDLNNLWQFTLSELRVLLSWQRSDRPWQLPIAAALASGVPVAVGAYVGLPAAGTMGAIAGLSFLYLPATSLHHRIPVIMACAFAMVASYALGAASQLVSFMPFVALAIITAAALLFCRAQAVVPPGPIFMVMSAAIGAVSPIPDHQTAIQHIGYFVLGCIWACTVAVVYSAHILRRRAPAIATYPSPLDLDVALVDAILTGLFVGASLALATVVGLEKAYWVPVSCMAVMQGVTLRASWRRNIHRIVGTALGLALTWVLLPFIANIWVVVATVGVLTLLIETAVVRHYAFAAIFITPLTIVLAESSAPGAFSTDMLMQARLVDTVVGALIGLAGAFCLHNQTVRHCLQRGLATITSRGATD